MRQTTYGQIVCAEENIVTNWDQQITEKVQVETLFLSFKILRKYKHLASFRLSSPFHSFSIHQKSNPFAIVRNSSLRFQSTDSKNGWNIEWPFDISSWFHKRHDKMNEEERVFSSFFFKGKTLTKHISWLNGPRSIQFHAFFLTLFFCSHSFCMRNFDGEIIKWWHQYTKSLTMFIQFIEMSKHYAHSNWQHHFIVKCHFFLSLSLHYCLNVWM